MDTKQKNPERAFIHDLATPLMVAQGMLDIASSLIEKEDDLAKVDPTKLKELISKSLLSVEKASSILTARRNHLIDLEKRSTDT